MIFNRKRVIDPCRLVVDSSDILIRYGWVRLQLHDPQAAGAERVMVGQFAGQDAFVWQLPDGRVSSFPNGDREWFDFKKLRIVEKSEISDWEECHRCYLHERLERWVFSGVYVDFDGTYRVDNRFRNWRRYVRSVERTNRRYGCDEFVPQWAPAA